MSKSNIEETAAFSQRGLQCLVAAKGGDDVEKEAEIEKKKEGEADHNQTKNTKANIVDFREEQIQQFQPLMKTMNGF